MSRSLYVGTTMERLSRPPSTAGESSFDPASDVRGTRPTYIVNVTINPGLAADPPSQAVDPDAAPVLTLLLPSSGGAATTEVPLRFVVRGSGYFVAAPAQPLPSWARALSAGSQVRWRVGDCVLPGTAAPATPASGAGAAGLPALRARHRRGHGQAAARGALQKAEIATGHPSSVEQAVGNKAYI